MAPKQVTKAATPAPTPASVLATVLATKQPAPQKKDKAAEPKKRPCEREGCQLFAQQGSPFCSNHRPAVERISQADRDTLSAWLEQQSPADRLATFVQAVGFVRAGVLATAIRSGSEK